MNRKTLILLSALIAVISVFFILRRNTGNTLTGDDNNFAYKSTKYIDKVFISNKKTGKYVLLKKIDSANWIVNDSFKVNIHQINTLFEGFVKMKVKRPVAKKELFEVKRNLAVNGTKVEIYENGDLSKVYYIGSNTADEMGTYFLMDKSEEPYVMHVPGFNGYIGARYHYQLEAWRSKNIFNQKEENIKSIQVQWHEDQASSFVIDNSDKVPVLNDGTRNYINNQEVNLNKIKSYLKLWENLSFEGFPIDLNPQKIDSIAHTTPLVTLVVTDKKGAITKLRIHRKGIKRDSGRQFDDEGNPLQFDLETFYAFINDNNKEIVQIQDYIFGKVMKKRLDFKL